MSKDENIQKEIKKKRKLKWQIKLIITILVLIMLVYLLGTKGIFIKEYKIKTSKIENNMHGLKILQFSDIHFGSSSNRKTISKLVKKINDAKPDVVIFTGDLIDENYKITTEEKDWLIKKLKEINEELGKYYVIGEEDFEQTTSILNLAGFYNLDNKEQLIYNNTKTPIVITGKNAIKDLDENEQEQDKFKIIALHNPDDIDKFKDYFDIALAGHTHNGQINIPKIKNLFINGKYYKNYQMVENTKLFINPGIGTSKINIRMFNHPTIYLFRLYKSTN